MTLFAAPLLIAIVIILVATPVTAYASSNRNEICRKVTLYPLTFPPGKGEHTILCHPVGKALIAANDANIQFNKGIVAAQQHPTAKCPAGHTKDYCQGWNYQKRWG